MKRVYACLCICLCMGPGGGGGVLGERGGRDFLPIQTQLPKPKHRGRTTECNTRVASLLETIFFYKKHSGPCHNTARRSPFICSRSLLSSSFQRPAVTLLMAKEILRPTWALAKDSNCIMNEWRGVWLVSCLPWRASNKSSWSPRPTASTHPHWFNWSKALPGCSQPGQGGHRPVGVLSFITIANNSLSLKLSIYLQWAMLPSGDPTCQKYHCIFICIILVFRSCHGSKIYTQQPRCHFRLQMELVCSQFGSAKKEICIYKALC